MKIECKVIEDLLPLYSDHVCSDASGKLVEEHLKECEKCRSMLNRVDVVQITHIEKEDTEKTAIIQKGFRKIHRRWRASLIAVFMLIPLVLVGILGYNEKNRSGIAFSNIDDVYRCYRYLNYIKSVQYDDAVQMVDFSNNDYKLVDCVSDMTLDAPPSVSRGAAGSSARGTGEVAPGQRSQRPAPRTSPPSGRPALSCLRGPR